MASVKEKILGILRVDFLLNEDAVKNWRFIVFVVFLAIIMIANSQKADRKVFRIAKLKNEVTALSSEFVATRKALEKLKLESTVVRKVANNGLFPSKEAPIKLVREKK